MRWFLIALVLLLLPVAVIAVLLHVSDPRSEIEQHLADNFGVPLTFDDDPGLTIFPGLGFRFARAEVNAPDGFPDQPLASLEGVHATLSLRALLRGKLVVQRLHVSDGRLDLVHQREAGGNWEALRLHRAGENEGSGPSLSLGGAQVITADRLRVRYRTDDTGDAYQLILSDLRLTDLEAGGSGRLETGWSISEQDGPRIAGQLESRLRLREDGWGLALQIEEATAELETANRQRSLSAEGRLLVDLERPGLQLRDGLLRLDEQLDLALSGTLLLRDGIPRATGEFRLRTDQLRQLVESDSGVTLDMSDDEAMRTLELAGRLRLENQRFSVVDLSGELDQTEISGTLDLNQEPGQVRFQLSLGAVNADRYTPATPDPDMIRRILRAKAAWARDRDVAGHVEIEELETLGLIFERFRMDLSGDGDTLTANPVTAAAWEGELDASVAMDLHTDPTAMRFSVNAFGIDPAIPLKALLETEPLSGTLEASISGEFRGLYWPEIRDSLVADGDLMLSDAEIRGFSLTDQVEDSVPGALGGADKEPFREDATTAISQLSGELTMAGGRLENPAAQARSTHFEAEGRGFLDLDPVTLDYRLELRMVENLDTESETLLSLLQDINVPVRIHGPLSDLDIEVRLPGAGEETPDDERGDEDGPAEDDQEPGTTRSSSPLG